MLERRRQAFLDASAANPFFWYSALTTALLMVLMFAYGVRVMDEKRKLWRAAEILNDVWNDAQYARATAETAIERHNPHMETCNRVIEAQLSGRPSPAALETTDARNELTRVRAELDSVDSERKLLKAKLDEKEKLVDDLSVRLSALEKGDQNSGGPVRKDTERWPRSRRIRRQTHCAHQSTHATARGGEAEEPRAEGSIAVLVTLKGFGGIWERRFTQQSHRARPVAAGSPFTTRPASW